ncbi:anhydro-N-acetylmuramic acid kinase [Colwellia sp. E2M01]|uniref:anhydro-N-acetylmuramic acid kinase n=1 Tax=Colwellia sp. E2M01 TaxID=2841561 RepID=UPI00339D8805
MSSNPAKAVARYYIGLMSGTSADGIDLALVDFANPDNKAQLVASYYQAYSEALALKITSLYQSGDNEIDRAFHLDIELAQLFSQAISAFLQQENLTAADIIAIGNHGQTIRHRPCGEELNGKNAFTLQIGCSQTLATLSSIRVIGQFRRKDMALGGQGAPLVPIFHQQLFKSNAVSVFIVNIGGIANITFLPEVAEEIAQKNKVLGFDTGPGNALLDDWFSKHHPESDVKFDKSGAWAAKGKVDEGLLTWLMHDQYIQEKAPKSTGREYFHLSWLEQQLVSYDSSLSQEVTQTIKPVDVQATLLAFTVQTIHDDIHALATQGKIYLCGGGAHNIALVNLLKQKFTSSITKFAVNTMQAVGIDGDQLEAMAFAWLAYAFDHSLNSNMPAVTGARASCTLGTEFLP